MGLFNWTMVWARMKLLDFQKQSCHQQEVVFDTVDYFPLHLLKRLIEGTGSYIDAYEYTLNRNSLDHHAYMWQIGVVYFLRFCTICVITVFRL